MAQNIKKHIVEVEAYSFFGKSVVLGGVLLGQTRESVKQTQVKGCFAKAD